MDCDGNIGNHGETLDNRCPHSASGDQHPDEKERLRTMGNVDGIFHVALPDKVRGKHALIIDDVVTTGSTLEACATELLKIDGTTVSAAALAAAE